MNLGRAFRDFRRPRRQIEGIHIFAYHGILERKSDLLLERNFHLLADFRSQLSALRKYRVLSLTEVLDELRAPTRESRPAAAITFDDGYSNNLLAAEVLAGHRLPWSVFVPTFAVGRANFLWTAELSLLLLHGEAAQLELWDEIWSLRERQHRESSFQKIRMALKALPALRRESDMKLIRQQFPPGETLRLLDEYPSLRMLSWEEIERLRSSGVEIGSHGVHHEIHHSDQPEAVRRFELAQSKAILEERLGTPCRSFAYPNGDAMEASARELRSAGYDLGFTTQRAVADAETNRYLLPRLDPQVLLAS